VELVVLPFDIEVILLVRVLIGLLVVLRIALIAGHGLIGGLPGDVILLLLTFLLFVLTALAQLTLVLIGLAISVFFKLLILFLIHV